jgi:hypothetical protein
LIGCVVTTILPDLGHRLQKCEQNVTSSKLDPNEVASIDRLAGGAAAAYDHLDAEALRREIELLRALTVGSQKNTI